jgi:two-component system cell cycle response regulator
MVSSSDILNARILVVDDQIENLELLGQMLRIAGYTSVALTSNPRDVCDLHRKNRYALILLDLQMPGLDGFGVMEGLKQIELEADSYVSVLAITGNPAHKLRALENGAKDFISKPFDPAEMFRRVSNLLEVRLLHEETRNQREMLESLALHDPLTGLANRRLLVDRMSVAVAQARRSKGCMAVMYLDLDGFKDINDTLGHGAGDILLKAVARRLTQSVREEDTVARLGGDEFVMTLPHIHGSADAAGMAAKVIDAVSQPYDIESRVVRMTTSVGIGIYPNDGNDAEALMKSADTALYEAKRAGKNTYRMGEHTLAGDNAQAEQENGVRPA